MSDVLDGATAPAVPEATSEPVAAPLEVTAEHEGELKPEAIPEKMLSQSEVNKIIQKEKAKQHRSLERTIAAEVENRLLKSGYQQTQQPEVKPTGEPKPSDFQDYEAYTRALVDHRSDQRFAELQQRQAQEAQSQRQQQHAKRVQEKLAVGQAKYDDFTEVVFNDAVSITPVMRDEIGESSLSAEIAYYLGSNLEEADRISRLRPGDQVREIVKLEAKLTALPTPTKTPPPIVPGGGSSATKPNIWAADYDFKKFVAARRAGKS